MHRVSVCAWGGGGYFFPKCTQRCTFYICRLIFRLIINLLCIFINSLKMHFRCTKKCTFTFGVHFFALLKVHLWPVKCIFFGQSARKVHFHF